MSDLSVFLNRVGAAVEAVFGDLEKLAPSTATGVTEAKAGATSAVNALVAAAPAIADTGVNALLGMLPEGALFAPAVDAVIDQAIELLTAKTSTAGPAMAPPVTAGAVVGA